jgi:hypothetical protein
MGYGLIVEADPARDVGTPAPLGVFGPTLEEVRAKAEQIKSMGRIPEGHDTTPERITSLGQIERFGGLVVNTEVTTQHYREPDVPEVVKKALPGSDKLIDADLTVAKGLLLPPYFGGIARLRPHAYASYDDGEWLTTPIDPSQALTSTSLRWRPPFSWLGRDRTVVGRFVGASASSPPE